MTEQEKAAELINKITDALIEGDTYFIDCTTKAILLIFINEIMHQNKKYWEGVKQLIEEDYFVKKENNTLR